MTRVLVATQSWGVLWEKAADRSLNVPSAGVLAAIDGTVYAGASGGTIVDPAVFVTNADGELPGYVDEGAYVLTVGADSFPVAALGGTLPGRVVALESGDLAVIPHGATAAAPRERPNGDPLGVSTTALWVGSVVPINAVDGDLRIPTS